MFRNFYLDKVLILDGATGTELAKLGMPAGVSPEAWCLEHGEAVNRVQSAYMEAGSDIVYTPTFGGNRLKLAEYGLEEQVYKVNRTLAEISRAGVSGIKVFGDIGPTGKFVEPFGELGFEEAVAIFREQAQALLDGGVDGFVIETMMDLQEARAALIGVREITELPVFVTMTFGEGDRTLTGNTPAAAVVTLQALGASAVGCNCSSGPLQMKRLVSAMREYAKVPLIAKPNAGMPRFEDGRTVFDMCSGEFGELAAGLTDDGAAIVGGCCGTSPEYIRSLSERVKGRGVSAPAGAGRSFVCSSSQVLELDPRGPFRIIGERLNPTGKKALQADLREGAFSLVRKIAKEQASAGAAMLDVNCGMPGIDEKESLRKVVSIVSSEVSLPLCIDTTNPAAAAAALRLYPGRALFNSISGERKRLEEVLPETAKYGAAIITLPLDDDRIPPTAEERAEVMKTIWGAAEKYGYGKEDLVMDPLIMSVSADRFAGKVALDTISWCSSGEWDGCSVCGLSNVSFGLPNRELLNRSFLASAIGRGLTFAIANPMSSAMLDTAAAAEILLGRDPEAKGYLARFANVPAGGTKAAAADSEKPDLKTVAFSSLVEGDIPGLDNAIDQLLASGMPAGEIVDSIMIPAIARVGEKYEKQEFYLPQLMAGARAMKAGMDKLAVYLKSEDAVTASAGRIIIATVKGDIHDIGKNIVAMMLKNYNFDVIDLGKDVPAEQIIDTALRENVNIIALSALMTTTMGEMKNVVELARSRGAEHLRFIVGGAVVDDDFAASINASYSRDAMETVRIAQKLSSGEE